LITLDGTAFAIASPQREGNRTNLREHACTDDNTSSTATSDRTRAISDVETISGASVFFKCYTTFLLYWERLAGQKCFVSVKINCFNQASKVKNVRLFRQPIKGQW
jgi:hypothetical protein